MKKLLIVFAFAAIATGANAQADKATPKTPAQPATKTAVDKQASQDYYTRVDGKVMMMKGGAKQELAQDAVQFENGNTLTREGVFIYNKGTEKMMLEEGMKIDSKGNHVGRGQERGRTAPTPDQPIQATPDKLEEAK